MTAHQRTVGFDVETGEITCKEHALTWADETALPKAVEARVVGLYPDYTFQVFEGWGCAMTEASCWLLSRMTPEDRRQALSLWFGPGGMDARFIRMHIDSCDYALSEYQSVADPLADPALETFNIDRDRKVILPVVKEALAMAGGRLKVLLSPWSPPWQWKTPPEFSQTDAAVYGGGRIEIDTTKPGRSFGGRLKSEYYGAWARYLVKFIRAYLDEGIPVGMLSIQNESSAATAWDSCLWSGEQERTFLREHLWPEMERAGLAGKIEIFIWDHNKERAIEHIDAFMADTVTAGMVDGFAWHWYTGDHFEALDMLHDRWPDRVLMHTESCPLHMPGKTISMSPTEDGVLNSGGSGDEKTPWECDRDDAMAYAHDIIGDFNHGMQRWIDWNMIVDENGGPRRVPGGFAAPLICREDLTVRRTLTYAWLETIAEAVRPGAVRIGKSVYTEELEVAACKNTDGSLSVVLLNRMKDEAKVNLRLAGRILRDVCLPAGTLTSLIIERGS
ncbi:MAG: glycoside hydrolase [Clostridia bacterium]|nr:glycoside hydrolase [Clostridia bacterium]